MAKVVAPSEDAAPWQMMAEYRYRSIRVGESGVSGQSITQNRITLGAAWQAQNWLQVGLALPVVWTDVERDDLSREQGTGLGDVEVRASFTVWRAAEHRVGVDLGAGLPTGWRQRADDGRALDIDAQAGRGALSGALAAWYRWQLTEWTVTLRASGHAATTGWQGYRSGAVFLGSVAARYRPHRVIELGLGLETRGAEHDHFDEIVDPDSGGWLVVAAPMLGLRPTDYLTVSVGAGLTLFNGLFGSQRAPLRVTAAVSGAF